MFENNTSEQSFYSQANGKSLINQLVDKNFACLKQ